MKATTEKSADRDLSASGQGTSGKRLKAEAVRASGSLLTTPGLVALAVVLVLSAWFAQTGILLLAALFLSTAGLARLWSRLALAGVRVERRFAGYRYFPGEAVACAVSLANRKPLPLPWVAVENDLPPGITPDSSGTARSAALLGYREITWRQRLICTRRGYYPLGPLRATAGDILGLYARTRSFGRDEQIIVYPRLFPLDPRVIPSLSPMGEHRTPRRLFQDPTHTLGVREYLPGDSLRRIHWKATARSADLQVKVLAATTAFKAAIFLDVEGFLPEGALNEADFELALSAAGSIAAALCRQGSPSGLFVNTRLADSGGPAAIAPAAGTARLAETLEALAKATPRVGAPFASFIDSHRAGLGAGTTLVLILGRPPETLPELAAEILQSGFRLMVLFIGDHPEPRLPENVGRHRIADADALSAWRPEGG